MAYTYESSRIQAEILKGNHIENWAWAKNITEILGPEHSKAIRQWEETNHEGVVQGLRYRYNPL